jgi:hypothetical protein
MCIIKIERDKAMDIIEKSKEDIQIHKDHLEDDWETHSELALEWHMKLATAIFLRDTEKEKLVSREAEKSFDIRNDPKNYGIEKITEGAIDTLLKTDRTLQDLRISVINIDYQVNLLKGVTTAFEHRKKALEEEVSLYIAGYFSPKLKPDLKPTTDTQVKLLNTKKRITNGDT